MDAAAAPTPADVPTKAVHDNIVKQRASPKKQVIYRTCEVCNCELAGQAVIDAHMAGSRHAKKVKAQELLNSIMNVKDEPPFRCEPCDVTVNSRAQLDGHFAGSKHKIKVGAKQGDTTSNAGESGDTTTETPTAPPVPVTPGNSKPTATNNLHCAVCNIHVNSPQQLEQHLSSKKHQDRESGRRPQRASPYSSPYPRSSFRGGRGGLGSQGRGGKGMPTKYTSLSNSFKSAGYSNTFIKPEGGVTMPKNPSNTNGNNMHHMSQSPSNQHSNPRLQSRNKGGFGSLSPYVAPDNQYYGANARGGFNNRGGGFHRGGWHGGNDGYGPQGSYAGFGNYGYDYSAYENYGGYNDYGMMHAGPSSY